MASLATVGYGREGRRRGRPERRAQLSRHLEIEEVPQGDPGDEIVRERHLGAQRERGRGAMPLIVTAAHGEHEPKKKPAGTLSAAERICSSARIC